MNEQQTAQRNALWEWLNTPKLLEAFIRAGVPNVALRHHQHHMDEYQPSDVADIIQVLLASRQARRAIASHVQRQHHVPRKQAMRALLEWAGKNQPESGA